MAEKEYIDREAVRSKLQEHYDFFVSAWGSWDGISPKEKARADEIQSCIAVVINTPAADVAPVVHGEWKITKSGAIYFCSCCEYFAMPRESREWKFCPRCGAKMDGGKK